jgi:hypothetical protein
MDGLAEMFNENTRRVRRCGCCRQEGHDRRTCPSPEEVERRRVAAERRREYVAQRRRAAARPNQAADQRKTYTLHNNNTFPIYVFWSKQGSDLIIYLKFISAESVASVYALPLHALTFIPAQEFTDVPTRDTRISLMNNNKWLIGAYNLSDYDDLNVYVISSYSVPKPPLDQWKECGLKSLFLLKELERMGASKYENLAPMMDMVQDIVLPEHTEMDKDNAGVPSAFTNVT